MNKTTTPSIDTFASHLNALTTPYATDSLHAMRRSLADDGIPGMPDFGTLFPNLDQRGPVAHEDSIFGPAAYFVDLMRLVQDRCGLEGTDPRHLFVRRADLLDIKLDARNTNEEKIYLEIANGTLLSLINRVQSAEDLPSRPLQDLADAPYPAGLPYHAPVENLRSYLGHFKTSLSEVLRHFGSDSAAQAREDLGLTRREYDLIATSAVTAAAIAPSLGIDPDTDHGLAALDALDAKDNFAHRIDMTADDLREVVYQGRLKSDLGYSRADQQLFIDRVMERRVHQKVTDPGDDTKIWIELRDGQVNVVDEGGSTAEVFQCITWAYDVLTRFIRLMRKLGWSAADLDLALRRTDEFDLGPAALAKLAVIRRLKDRLGLPVDALCALWGPIETNGQQDTQTDLFFRLFGFDWKRTEEQGWGTTRESCIFLGQSPSWLKAGLRCSDDDLKQAVAAVTASGRVSPTEITIDGKVDDKAVDLKLQTLQKLYQVVQLARLVKRPVADVVLILSCGYWVNEPKDLTELLDTSQWLAGAGITPETFHQMVTGEGVLPDSEAAARALFAEVSLAIPAADLRADSLPAADSGSPETEGAHRADRIDAIAAAQFGVDKATLRKMLDTTIPPEVDLRAGYELIAEGALAETPTKAEVNPPTADLMRHLAHRALVIRTLGLTLPVVSQIVSDHPNVAGLCHGSDRPWHERRNLRSLASAARSEREWGLRWRDLLSCLSDFVCPTGPSLRLSTHKPGQGDGAAAELMAELRGWPLSAVSECLLADGLFSEPPDTGRQDDDRPPNLLTLLMLLDRLTARFALAARIGVDARLLAGIAAACAEDVGGDDAKWRAHWHGLDDMSHQLFDAIRAKYAPAEWPGVHDPIAGKLAERLRDAICTRALWLLSLPGTDAKWRPFGEPRTIEDLSDLLLVDFEMTGAVKISKVKLGLNTLQRYIQRCHMGLEKPATLPLADAEWSWRSHYRLWEANRRVFLYPENYLDPGLRRHKTPLFVQLEQDLLQGNINDDTVTQAYMNYFDGLEQIADLEIVSACQAEITPKGSKTGERHVFFVGRTRADPPEYFVRRAIFDDTSFADHPEATEWRPWERIALNLHVSQVSCLFVNGRLHLYWAEQQTKNETTATDTKLLRTLATVKFSYQRTNGTWLTPQPMPGLTDILICEAIRHGHDDVTFTTRFTDRMAPFPPGRPRSPLFLYTRPGSEPHAPVALVGLRLPPCSSAVRSSVSAPSAADALAVPIGPIPLQEEATDSPSELLGGGWTLGADVRPSEMSGVHEDCRISHFLNLPDGGLLAGVSRQGIYHSANSGRSWTLRTKTDFSDDSPSLLTHGVDRNTVLACFGGDGGERLHRSTDGGQTWSPVGEAGMKFLSIVLCPDQRTLLAVTLVVLSAHDNFDRIMTSVDDGQTWTTSSHQIGGTDLTLLLGPEDGSLLAFVTSALGTVEIWTSAQGEPAGPFHKINDDALSSGFMHALVAADRSIVVCIHGGQFHRTTDSGRHWVPTAFPHSGTVIYCLFRAPDGTLLAGTGKGICVSGDHGQTWRIDTTAHATDVAAIGVGSDGATLFACGKRGNYGAVYDVLLEIRPSAAHCLQDQPGEGGKPPFTALVSTTGADKTAKTPLVSRAAATLGEKLVGGGIDTLLAPATQRAALDIDGEGRACPVNFSPASPFGMYYAEVFFHVPFLIADTLNANQKFEQAQGWYHHIFRPVQPETADELDSDAAGCWRFVPFTQHKPERLEVNLATYPQEYSTYLQDPFDPYAIADLRPGATEKAVVMRYIDNLIDWGDQLFRQNSWESTVQAMILYKVAEDLLGRHPAPDAPKRKIVEARTFATFAGDISAKGTPADAFHLSDLAYFPVPRNETFNSYWARAAEQLDKIRRSLDIDGIARQLALFQPEIDPRAVIAAMAGGQSLPDIAAGRGAGNVPHYRFLSVLHQAKAVTAEVIQLGSALLGALDRKDAAHLGMLRMTHERALLGMTQRIRERQADEAAQHLLALQSSRDAAVARHDYFQSLVSGGLTTGEVLGIAMGKVGIGLHAAATYENAAATPVYLFPAIFGLADGGASPGAGLQATAAALESGAAVAANMQQLAFFAAEHERRAADWDLQARLAELDVQQLDAEIRAAGVRSDILKIDRDLQEKSIAQAQEVATLLQDQFTGEALYGWMSRRIATVYFQAYKLAYDLARDAEAAYRFERTRTDHDFVIQPTWDSLQKGLLAGEGLMLGLNLLEKAWRDTGKRPLEIQKTISLRVPGKPFPGRFENGVFVFDLLERYFDQDFPGHYCRKIRSIAITIPAIVGPYQNLRATLTQTTNRLVTTDQDIEAVKTLLRGPIAGSSAMVSGRVSQQVVLSSGVNDAGYFEPVWGDDSYLPFEGTGAVSSWKLEINPRQDAKLLESITDVIVYLRYTAEQGSSDFRENVETELASGG